MSNNKIEEKIIFLLKNLKKSKSNQTNLQTLWSGSWDWDYPIEDKYKKVMKQNYIGTLFIKKTKWKKVMRD